MPMKLSVKYIYSTIWHVSLLSEEFMIRNYQLLIRGTHEIVIMQNDCKTHSFDVSLCLVNSMVYYIFRNNIKPIPFVAQDNDLLKTNRNKPFLHKLVWKL